MAYIEIPVKDTSTPLTPQEFNYLVDKLNARKINNLIDVEQTDAQDGNIMKHNGSGWVWYNLSDDYYDKDEINAIVAGNGEINVTVEWGDISGNITAQLDLFQTFGALGATKNIWTGEHEAQNYIITGSGDVGGGVDVMTSFFLTDGVNTSEMLDGDTLSIEGAGVTFDDTTNTFTIIDTGLGGGGWNEGSTWKFSSLTDGSQPASGRISYNNVDPTLVTEIYISDFNEEGNDASAYLSLLKEEDVLYLQEAGLSDIFITCTVLLVTDNNGWFTIQVAVENAGIDVPSNNSTVHVAMFAANNQEVAIAKYDEGNGKGYYPVGQDRTLNVATLGLNALDMAIHNGSNSGNPSGASGSHAVAFGVSTRASGYASVAFGESTQATGSNSFVSGYDVLASAWGSMSFGYLVDSTNQLTFSQGYDIQNSGYASVAFGLNQVIQGFGNYAFTAGLFNDVSDYSTVAMGAGLLISDGDNTGQAAVGIANEYVNSAAFVVGNGTMTLSDPSYTNWTIDTRSNAFVAMKSGDILAPSLTEQMITDEVTGKSLTTKEWVNTSIQAVKNSYMMPIWAEENEAIATGTFEWAFGDGANTPSGHGVTIYVPTGYVAEIVSMTASSSAVGTSTIEASINGVNQGALCNVTMVAGNGVNDSFTPVALISGDKLNFRTELAGTSGTPNIVTAFIRYTEI